MNPDKAVGNSSDSGKAATTGSGVAVAVKEEPEQINQIHNESQDDEKNINTESSSSLRESLCMQQQEPGPSGLVVSSGSHCGIEGGGEAEEEVDGKSTVAKAEKSFGHGTLSSPQLQQQIGKENAREPKRVETSTSAKTAALPAAHEKAATDRASVEHSLVSVELSKRAVVPKCALSYGSESTKTAVESIKTNSEDKVVITATSDKCRYASAFVQLVEVFGAVILLDCVWVVCCGGPCWQYWLNWLINYIHGVNSMNDWRSPSL